MIRRFLLLFALASTAFSPVRAQDLPPDLRQYLETKEENYGWETKNHGALVNCDFWHLTLRSQTWQEIPWTHDLVVFRPQGIPATNKMLLINEGGRLKPDKLMFGITLANIMKTPVAMLLGVPNQPLLDGKTEDHLIAETFVRYLETGDNRWPLLFPMVKSVVKAMDAIGEFTEAEWETKTTGFIISGASKRGWTAWLAAAADPRVVAMAPMVIDLLNIPEQLPLQVARFGRTSEMISPYTDRGLVPFHDTEEARALWRMVDPWTYRSQYDMPKLILLGTNDPYWTTDALNVYWGGLPEDKYISYSPNAGHGLMERGAEVKLPWRAVNSLAAFVRSQVNGTPLPELSWKHDDAPDGDFRLTVQADPMPQEVTLWVARSPVQDFRRARWESEPVEVSPEGAIVISMPPPAEGYVAFFADLGYEFEGLPLRLSTQLRLDGPAGAAGK